MDATPKCKLLIVIYSRVYFEWPKPREPLPARALKHLITQGFRASWIRINTAGKKSLRRARRFTTAHA